MAPLESNTVMESGLPSWLQTMQLEAAIRTHIGCEFKRILNRKLESVSAEGENYSSLLLRIMLEVELADENTKTVSFVLKTHQANVAMAKILEVFRIFPKEEEMYHKIIPQFEELYRKVGKSMQFAPKAYKFDKNVNVDYVLLEDLRAKNFKNANRLHGLDMEHSKEVLNKLAQMHAASACYVEQYGMFSSDFVVGVFGENNRELQKQFNNSDAFLCELKKWSKFKTIYEKLRDSDPYLVDRLLKDQKIKSTEFNVLNHGDCWANNIMFQYDAFGKIKNTYFVDFALGKYGSPANDLYYFILSSTQKEIKLQKFDFMIKYYYDKLIENLEVLEYARPLPKLLQIHQSLLSNGLCAYMVVSKVLPAVILERTDNANLENYIKEKSHMKNSMFNNHKYIQAMADILPWLDNRGLLDWN